MELRELLIEDENEDGVFAISLVTHPAMDEKFIMMSEEDKPLIKMAKIDEDKRLILGLVLEPNKKIYRRDKRTGEEYEVFLREETIEKAAYLYLQKGQQKNVTFEHEAELKDISVVETWIVADSEKDKSAIFGYNYPVGSWLVVMKVQDPNTWKQLKEETTVSGFSIEGFFEQKPLEAAEMIAMCLDLDTK